MTTIATINAIWGHLRSTAQCQTATTEGLAVCDALIARLPDEQAEAARHYLSRVTEVGPLVDMVALCDAPEGVDGALDARKHQTMPFDWWTWYSADGCELSEAHTTARAVNELAELHNALAAAITDGVTARVTPDGDSDDEYQRIGLTLQWSYPGDTAARHASVVGDIMEADAWDMSEELARSGDEDNAHLSLLKWMRADHAEAMQVALEHWGRTGEDMIKRAEAMAEELIDEWAEEADAD